MRILSDGNPVETIEGYLHGVQFPALKHDVVQAVRRSVAPIDIISRVESIPLTRFKNAQQVVEAYDELE
jgi:hypothetical protein